MSMGVYSVPILYTFVFVGIHIGVYISAWASALLVQLTMGNARASECGMSDGKTPTLEPVCIL